MARSLRYLAAGLTAVLFFGLCAGSTFAQRITDRDASRCRSPAEMKEIAAEIDRLANAEKRLTDRLARLERVRETDNDRYQTLIQQPHPSDDDKAKTEKASQVVKYDDAKILDVRIELGFIKTEIPFLRSLKPCPPTPVQTEFDKMLMERFRTGNRPEREPVLERVEIGGSGRAWMEPNTHLGLFLGGTALTSLPTSSTSGFYSGGLSGTPVGFAFGGSVFRDFATFGNAPGPFGTFVLSAGVVLDYVSHAPINWSGTCGGAACTGSGNMSEFNYIAELKATTPISPGNTVNGYIGVGGASLWPSGTPTGLGGPSFQGSGTAPAFRVGWGLDHQFSQNWSAGVKVGFQFTGNTEYGTSLAGERFRLDRKNEVIFGTTLTYTPSDIRLKRDIAIVGHLANGLGLYRYRYVWSDQVYVGIMAQEVEQIDPDAVMRGDDGYLRVNYARLGLRMQTWDEWKALH